METSNLRRQSTCVRFGSVFFTRAKYQNALLSQLSVGIIKNLLLMGFAFLIYAFFLVVGVSKINERIILRVHAMLISTFFGADQLLMIRHFFICLNENAGQATKQFWITVTYKLRIGLRGQYLYRYEKS
jgi:hypothetical protein